MNIRQGFGWSASPLPTQLGCSRRKTSERRRKRKAEGGWLVVLGRDRARERERQKKKVNDSWILTTSRQRKVRAVRLGGFEVSGEVHVELVFLLSLWCKHISVVVTLRRERQSRGKGLLPVCWRIQFWLQWKETRLNNLTVHYPGQVRLINCHINSALFILFIYLFLPEATVGHIYCHCCHLYAYEYTHTPTRRFLVILCVSTEDTHCFMSVCSTGDSRSSRFTQHCAVWASCPDYSPQAPPTVFAT